MYARFLPILNAKKAQISELLSKADQEGNDMDESAKRSRLNFSSSDEDENEDEEMEEHPWLIFITNTELSKKYWIHVHDRINGILFNLYRRIALSVAHLI